MAALLLPFRIAAVKLVLLLPLRIAAVNAAVVSWRVATIAANDNLKKQFGNSSMAISKIIFAKVENYCLFCYRKHEPSVL